MLVRNLLKGTLWSLGIAAYVWVAFYLGAYTIGTPASHYLSGIFLGWGYYLAFVGLFVALLAIAAGLLFVRRHKTAGWTFVLLTGLAALWSVWWLYMAAHH